jgi:hypothetical protein
LEDSLAFWRQVNTTLPTMQQRDAEVFLQCSQGLGGRQ